MDTQKDGLEKVVPFKYGPFLVSMLVFWSVLEKKGETRSPTNPWGPLDFQDPYQVIQEGDVFHVSEVTYTTSTKRSRFNHPKQITKNRQVKNVIFGYFYCSWDFPPRFFFGKNAHGF